MLRSRSIGEKFERLYEPEPMSGCWLWIGTISDIGYGMFSAARETYGCPEIMAHRISWHLHHGNVPPGIKVLHRCDVRACVNPAHLFLGTQADNIMDMMRKGRHRTVPQPGARNGMAKLTPELVHQMRRAHANGTSQHALARQYGVAVMTVNRAVRGLSWGAQ